MSPCMRFLVACVVGIDHHSKQLIWKLTGNGQGSDDLMTPAKANISDTAYFRDQFELWILIGKNISMHMEMFISPWTGYLQKNVLIMTGAYYKQKFLKGIIFWEEANYNRLGAVGNRNTKKLQLGRFAEILRNSSCLDSIRCVRHLR